ncbi:right-handed parallel beta-helix repeat-containing protein [Novosphingobium ginsenosidimutans]|nr:right-handed parallel beta-helix repeat-containing protein [Novosphingobium ginsenosidimutans]
MAIWTVTNSTELANAISKAAAGDEIKVAAGEYPSLSIRYKLADTPIKITALDPSNPPVFNSVVIFGSTGIVLDGLTYKLIPSATSTSASSAITITQSSGISVLNSKITGGPSVNGVDPSSTVLDATGNVLGLPVGRGIMINKSSDIRIEGNDISLFHKGVVMAQSNGVTIHNNEIHDLRSSPIVGSALNDITISSNHTYNYTPWAWGTSYGDHGDLIHIWTDANYQTTASKNIIIKDNFLTQGTGTAMLGIFLANNSTPFGYENVVIQNNIISNANNQALRLEHVQGIVTGNTAIAPDNSMVKGSPGLIAAEGSSLTITNNLLGHVTVYTDSTSVQSGNMIITRADPNAAGYYGKVFINGLATLPKLEDLAKIDGITAGAVLTWAGQLAWEASTTTTTTTTTTTDTSGTISPGTVLVEPVPADSTTSGSTSPTSTTTTTEPAPTPAPAPTQPVINGTAGVDNLSDKGIASKLFGLAGDDFYTVSATGTTVNEVAGGGIDTVNASVNFTLSAEVEHLNLTGSAVNGTGNGLANYINSDAGSQVLSGLGGNDRLSAGAGNDTVYGGDGNDIINGGSGNDKLYGGAGKDAFVFDQSSVANNDFDEIFDFVSRQDKIDLRGIDANSNTSRNDTFTPIWGANFSKKAGELQIKAYAGGMLVSGDVNGDGVPDFSMMVHGVSKLLSTDFNF